MLTNALHLVPFLQKPYANTLIIHSDKDLWQDYTGVLNFINQHTPKNAILYTDIGDENYFYGLNTGRTTLDFFIFLPKAVMNQSCPQASVSCLNQWFAHRAEATYRVLRKSGANYGILNRFALIKNQYNNWSLAKRAMPIIPLMIQQHPQAFQPVYQSEDGWITVYRILPEASP